MKDLPKKPLSIDARIKIACAGGMASAASVLPGQPLDVLKTRKHAEPGFSYKTLLTHMKQQGGVLWRSLYAGLSSKLMVMGFKGFYRADLMTTIPAWIENALPETFVEKHKIAPALLAVVPITTIDVLIRTPLEAVNRLRMMKGTTMPWSAILKEVGKNPYATTFPTATKDLISWGLFLGVDESVKLYVREHCPAETAHIAPFISTAIIACIKTYATNPIDMVITSVQKDNLSFVDAIGKVKAGGARAACAGAVPRLLMSATDAFIGSSIRDWSKKIRQEEEANAGKSQGRAA